VRCIQLRMNTTNGTEIRTAHTTRVRSAAALHMARLHFFLADETGEERSHRSLNQQTKQTDTHILV